jgi:hypothetical protein
MADANEGALGHKEARLDKPTGALENLGLEIKSSESGQLIAVGTKWHWDCVFTKVTYVVVVRTVSELTPDIIESDRKQLEKEAKNIDPSRLPRGFQKGIAVLVNYVAETVTPEAHAVLEKRPKVKWAYFYVPAAMDLSNGKMSYLKSTPAWGGIYFSKFRHVIKQVLDPDIPKAGWPVSVGGAVLSALLVGMIGLSVFRFLS